MDGHFLTSLDEKKTIAMTRVGIHQVMFGSFILYLEGGYRTTLFIYLQSTSGRFLPGLTGDCCGEMISQYGFIMLGGKETDYILVVKPWPVELKWIEQHQEEFQLVFTDEQYKIYKYTGEQT